MDHFHEFDLVPVLLVEVDAPEHGGLPVRLLQLLQNKQRCARLYPDVPIEKYCQKANLKRCPGIRFTIPVSTGTWYQYKK
jgi:hypothetical protein